MSNRPVFNPISRISRKKGLNSVVDAVKITIGPVGKNVLLKGNNGPIIANDAWTIAQSINLKNHVEDLSAQCAKGVIQKTSEIVGGGRTASAIFYQSMVEEGTKYAELGLNMNLVRKGMKQASDDIVQVLKTMAREVKTKQELIEVATISTESAELGKIIADTVHKIGKDGVVTVEDSPSIGIAVLFKEGIEFDKGYVSRAMTTNDDANESLFENVEILITDKKLSSYKDIRGLLEKPTDNVLPNGQKKIEIKRNELVIIADDYADDLLNFFTLARMGGLKVLAIKAPSFGEMKKEWLNDLAASVGAIVVSDATGVQITDEVLGKAKKVKATADTTVITEGTGELKSYIDRLSSQITDELKPYEKDALEKRIARLSNGIAIIKVGTASERELKYLKLKVQDGISESKRALEEGIIPGGNVAFIIAAKKLAKKQGTDGLALGYNLVCTAIERPLKQIIENGNGASEVIINEIKKSESDTIGYDALKGEIVEDMYAAGIVDAVKVARVALQNAVEEAALFLTIDATIAEDN